LLPRPREYTVSFDFPSANDDSGPCLAVLGAGFSRGERQLYSNLRFSGDNSQKVQFTSEFSAYNNYRVDL